MDATGELDELLDVVRHTIMTQLPSLRLLIEVLETAQRSLPRIRLAELDRMRRGNAPAPWNALLLSRLEGSIVDLEDVAGNLEEDFGQEPDREASIELTPAEFRDLEGAIRRVAGRKVAG